MNQTANEIQSEIEQTDSRITQLQTQLSKQTASFEGVQESFITGKANIDQLHAEQSKLTLISQAIEALKATYQKLKSAFNEQSETERRAELLKQMATAANEVPALVDEYLKTRLEFHEAVADYAKTLLGKRTAYQNKQIEYQTLASELKPTPAELQNCELSEKTLQMASATYFNHPSAGIFTDVVSLAENTLGAKLDSIAQERRTAKFNEEKLAYQQQIKAATS
jgi:archaellum component FlaC